MTDMTMGAFVLAEVMSFQFAVSAVSSLEARERGDKGYSRIWAVCAIADLAIFVALVLL